MSPNDPLPILRPRRYLLPTLSSCWLMLLPPSPKLLEGPLSLLAPLPAAASRSRSPPPLLFSPLSCFEDPPYPRNLLLLFVDCSLLPRIPNLLLAPPLLLLFSFEAADAEPLSVRTTPTKLFCADKLSGMNYTRWRRPSVVLPVVLPSRARLKASNATEFSVPIQQKKMCQAGSPHLGLRVHHCTLRLTGRLVSWLRRRRSSALASLTEHLLWSVSPPVAKLRSPGPL
mmetsp:Transcript_5457/g.13648  ORF Transcript_5457/g.13648 Transcript_5457/m.13648 type:complete len:228 (-) Transcript_5457:388-1071(-)